MAMVMLFSNGKDIYIYFAFQIFHRIHRKIINIQSFSNLFKSKHKIQNSQRIVRRVIFKTCQGAMKEKIGVPRTWGAWRITRFSRRTPIWGSRFWAFQSGSCLLGIHPRNHTWILWVVSLSPAPPSNSHK